VLVLLVVVPTMAAGLRDPHHAREAGRRAAQRRLARRHARRERRARFYAWMQRQRGWWMWCILAVVVVAASADIGITEGHRSNITSGICTGIGFAAAAFFTIGFFGAALLSLVGLVVNPILNLAVLARSYYRGRRSLKA
jgi:hypothetical protein